MTGVLLLGGTDITLAVAGAALASGVRLSTVVGLPTAFSISYSRDKVASSRYADIAGWCARHGVPYLDFVSYDAILDRIAPDGPTVCLVAGWYHMVPRRFRERFSRGCYGFHASLLPQLRGGAPLNWAILDGLSETGVTLFEMADSVDDGLIMGQERFPIGRRAVIADLVRASQAACAALTERCLPALLAGACAGRPQGPGATYGLQRRPEDGCIDWRLDADTIDRLVRASGRPYSGAFSVLEDEQIHIWDSLPGAGLPRVLGAPGQIVRLDECPDPCVVTGAGLLIVRDATSAGGDACLDKLRKSGHKRFSQ